MSTIDSQIKDDAVAAALSRVAAAMADLSPLMRDIGDLLQSQTDERFRTGTAPDGTPWAPRSPVTMAQYGRRGDKPGPHPLLGASRRLSTTIHHQSGPDYVEIGSAAVQAAVMQFGAAQGAFGARMGRTTPTEKRPKSQDYFFPIPWGNIPARPYLGLSQENSDDIVAEINEWLASATAG